jgi:hypothetical protein
MKTYAKVGVGLGALIVALVLAGEARAAFTLSGGTLATGVLQDWIDLGNAGLQQQDKLWVYHGSTILPGTLPLTIKTEVLGNGTDIHSLMLGDIDFADTGATLNYSIQITTPNNGGLNNFVFRAATLDTSTVGVGSSAVKNFYSVNALPFLTLTSTDGSAQTATIAGQLTSLFIRESWTVNSNGDINQTFNTFTEGAVPEPASIAIWSLLGAGGWLGVRVWRRRGRSAGGQAWSPENRQAIHNIIARGTSR